MSIRSDESAISELGFVKYPLLPREIPWWIEDQSRLPKMGGFPLFVLRRFGLPTAISPERVATRIQALIDSDETKHRRSRRQQRTS